MQQVEVLEIWEEAFQQCNLGVAVEVHVNKNQERNSHQNCIQKISVNHKGAPKFRFSYHPTSGVFFMQKEEEVGKKEEQDEIGRTSLVPQIEVSRDDKDSERLSSSG